MIGATAEPHAAGDAAMPFVRRALDPVWLQPHLDAMIGKPVRVVSATVTRWKPGRRCVIEYVLAAGDASPMTVIGKVRARSFDHATFALTKQVSDRLSQSPEAPLVAVPAARAAVPECHLWLQEKVDGASAWSRMSAPDGVDIARNIGRALACLHRAFPPLSNTHGITKELAVLDDRLERVCAARPLLAARVRRVRHACKQLAAKLRPAVRSGIHRDFYHDQVIVEGNRVWMLDLDLAADGDPALDVGNFIAHLSEQALRLRGDSRTLAAHESALVDGFRDAGGRASTESIEIYRTLTLARHIYITTLFEERQPFTGAVLSLCEQHLQL